MARTLEFYSFSASHWRAHVGSRDEATIAKLAARIDREFDANADNAEHRASLSRIVQGAVAGTIGNIEETWAHSWVARELAGIGQQPESGPAVGMVWYAVSQLAIGDALTATNPSERRVVRYLKEGRPLLGECFGEGFAGRSRLSDIYGWLDADDGVESLASVLSSASIAEYPVAKKSRKKWDAELAAALDWAKSLVGGGKDVFFSSEHRSGWTASEVRVLQPTR